jgi:hypothetical protein
MPSSEPHFRRVATGFRPPVGASGADHYRSLWTGTVETRLRSYFGLTRSTEGRPGSGAGQWIGVGPTRASSIFATIRRGPVAQWQSSRLLICLLRVRAPPGSPIWNLKMLLLGRQEGHFSYDGSAAGFIRPSVRADGIRRYPAGERAFRLLARSWSDCGHRSWPGTGPCQPWRKAWRLNLRLWPARRLPTRRPL